jgi:hypothetical protein
MLFHLVNSFSHPVLHFHLWLIPFNSIRHQAIHSCINSVSCLLINQYWTGLESVSFIKTQLYVRNLQLVRWSKCHLENSRLNMNHGKHVINNIWKNSLINCICPSPNVSSTCPVLWQTLPFTFSDPLSLTHALSLSLRYLALFPILWRVHWTSKLDLSSTTKCDQNYISHTYKFGHT